MAMLVLEREEVIPTASEMSLFKVEMNLLWAHFIG